MSKFIDDTLLMGLGNMISESCDPHIMADEIYRKDTEDAEALRVRLDELDFTQEQRMVMEDYISCLMSAQARACDISYLVGCRNTIMFLSETGAIGNLNTDK